MIIRIDTTKKTVDLKGEADFTLRGKLRNTQEREGRYIKSMWLLYLALIFVLFAILIKHGLF